MGDPLASSVLDATARCGTRIDSPAVLIIPRPIDRWATPPLLLVLAATLLAARSGSLTWWLLTCAAGAATSLLVLAGNRAWRRTRPAPGTVTIAGGRALVMGNRSTDPIAVREIVEGFFVPPDTVRLVARAGEALVLRTTRQDAQRVLAAAGVSTRQRALSMRLASPLGGRRVGAVVGEFCCAAVLCWASRGPTLQGVALTAVLVAATMIIRVVHRRSVKIGNDGLLLRTGFCGRFVPYAFVRRAYQDRGGVVVEENDGNVITLRLDDAREELSALHASLLERINDAMVARGAPRQPPEPISGDYRTAHHGLTELARVVEDPAAHAAERIAAAISIWRVDDVAARTCVARVAPACANEAFVRALRGAVRGTTDRPRVRDIDRGARFRRW